MKKVCWIVLVAFSVCLIGCNEEGGMTREGKGATAGAIAGAVIGGVIGSKSGNAGKGILIGAAAGAAGGYLVGKMTKPKEGEAATVVCPYCNTQNTVPDKAKAGDVIQCFSCGKNFKLQ
jgi:uncharacterized protein YcfJ